MGLKKKFNFKCWIIVSSISIFVSLLLLIILKCVIKSNIFWLFFAFTLVFSIILLVLIIFKIKRDKKEKEEIEEEERRKLLQEEENKKRLELEEKIKREKEEELRKQKEDEIRKQKEEELKKQQEEERINEMKKKMLENQKILREAKEDSENMTEQQKNKKINQVLEDMCIYGEITKKELKKEKEEHPEKFVETSKALNMEDQDPGLFALGLISQNLENLGIETAIESNQDLNEQDNDSTSLQFITNGMVDKKKYDLHFEFGEERNEELLNNEAEYEKFKENLKLKLSKDYNLPPEKIIVTFPQKGSFHVQLIFQSDDFHDLYKNQFINKFKNDPEFKELANLKDIHEDVIMGAVKLTRNQLDPRGNRNDGWGDGEKRGGKDYDPPIGFNGIGLKVWDKYGDNTWLGMNNAPGEWCVAYHGVASGQTSEDVKNVTGIIAKTTFKEGSRQAHSGCPDQYHPGQKVGVGVYCTPTIKTASEQYAGISEINGIKYKTVLMVRVKPSAIRHCDNCWDSKAPYNYWVVNGTEDEIRPYRILYKKCN